jgi:hypothetical protein
MTASASADGGEGERESGGSGKKDMPARVYALLERASEQLRAAAALGHPKAAAALRQSSTT